MILTALVECYLDCCGRGSTTGKDDWHLGYDNCRPACWTLHAAPVLFRRFQNWGNNNRCQCLQIDALPSQQYRAPLPKHWYVALEEFVASCWSSADANLHSRDSPPLSLHDEAAGTHLTSANRNLAGCNRLSRRGKHCGLSKLQKTTIRYGTMPVH